ncbi:GDSL lipase/acylhydrolase family protein [Penicillium subrubescens]|uniref:GDSL lipase/acylhydrolase family protein n=1 Tax=Penicillium subrubescens TaxID=1316194 RepID=UPI002544DE2F|nr:GDSL lipase/acylhydrolase family protein [Penicillium subrubescens]KAJ5904645.1 GDSL lipase/acylhydrolase family protein [Penicillium subrubescens]
MDMLDWSAPANVTGFNKNCDVSETTCTKLPSFLWFDELHPSPRTVQIIAQNFTNVVKGKSKWATY